MTRPAIEKTGLISLDGKTYRLKGRVRSFLQSNFTDRILIGAPSMEGHPEVSYLRWDDWTEGIGLEEFFSAGGEAPKRAWWSECQLWFSKHLVLGPLVNSEDLPTNHTFSHGTIPPTLKKFIDFDNELYLLAYTDDTSTKDGRVYKWDESTPEWTDTGDDYSDTPVLASTVREALVINLGGTNYIVAGMWEDSTDTAYSYWDGVAANWTKDDATGAMTLVEWDERLWLGNADGSVSYAAALGTETSVTRVPIPSHSDFADEGYLKKLMALPDATGEPILHAITRLGVFAYDVSNDRWIATHIVWPDSKYNGYTAVLWQGDLYVAMGGQVWQVVFGSPRIVRNIGPDLDHGLPSDRQLFVTDIVPTPNFIIVSGLAQDTGRDKPPILAWDGKGWHVLEATDTGNEQRTGSLFASAADNNYRLWWATRSDDNTTYYIDLPRQLLNPSNVTGFEYAASSEHITPWFKVGEDVTGIALSMLVEVQDASANETVQVEYDVDYSGTWKDFYDSTGTTEASAANPITSDGTTELTFRETSTNILPEGITFRAIRFRLTLSRGSTTTNTPDVRSLTLKFLKKLKSKWNHFLTLDISEETGGFSPRQQWANLRTTIDKGTLVEFTHKDLPAIDAEQRMWVRVAVPQAEEDSGLEYRGEANLQLIEP